ncbi:MAG: lipopolysaccharide heptosyltransferase II [Candidatus Omnitrophica bacterium]|nr:lipopolysaccharide heptosyltransferase II [Candidatus Omnitrophota bacterium]MBU4472850.1 lipopolysaccharide heptosyltransferase II [Candidatus Omnitrophota bacterium]MCG2706043.1 lipopolysaccharide heptosyltransferase II [Candidatus Omnitrophota bacterium]
MNILQILPELNVGGVETGTVDLARHLIRQGHKAVVVSSGGEMVKDLESFGAKHYQLPVHKKSLFTMIMAIPRLAEIIKKEEIDIVHARSRVPAWIAYFASRKTARVFITTCHGYYKKHPFGYVMGWAKSVIVLSNVIARHMIDDFSVPYERIKLIPRSVDLERFKYVARDEKRGSEFNVGIIARITPIKGHLYFIKAMAEVYRVIPRLKIWIVGDAPASKGAYKEQVEVLVKRLGLWHITQFLGVQRDIPAILGRLDLLVLSTTTHEAFGRVIIEAQACGVPVVATRVGGVIDIIEDGQTGLLVPPSDPKGIAEAAIKIFKDKELAVKLTENAYKKVKEKYNVGLMVENTLNVYRQALENFKILIIKFSSLGDIILSTPAIKAIRDKFPPNYKISFLTSQECKEALLTCPYIDELLVSDFKNKDKGIKGLMQWGRILREKNFDMVVDLQNNRKSHILCALSLALTRYGYGNNKLGLLLNHRVKDEKPAIGPVTHQFRILQMLGINLENPNLELWPTPEDENYIEQFLSSEWISSTQRLVGINISASPKWTTKNWPLRQLTKLCQELSHRDIRFVITGTGRDLNSASALMNMLRSTKFINACGKTTVNQLACLIKRCSVYISPDSAPLHIACAVGTPFIALFGPTDPRRHLPPAKDCIVIKKDLACSPCYKSKCKTRTCMELISSEEVLEAVDKLLK